MKLAFIFVGGDKEPWSEEACQVYLKKIGAMVKTEVIRLKPAKLARAQNEIKRDQEEQLILKHLNSNDFIILCDEKGDTPDSRQFSAKLVRAFESGKARVVIIVGGAFGVGQKIVSIAHWKCSLSSFTLNHLVAQITVMEQTFRGLSIWKNLPYHND